LTGDDNRLLYLHDCVGLIRNSIQKASKMEDLRKFKISCFPKLVNLLRKELDHVKSLLKENVEKGKSLNVNFDIFEFTLMRYICQLNAMFLEATEHVIKTPSAIIQDEIARQKWDNLVGEDVHSTGASFLEAVWFELGESEEGDNDHHSREFLFFEYCINFPRDNIITAYKWHCVCSQFGPFGELKANFKKFSTNGGFVGVINSIQAAEMLEQEPLGTTIIRFSRLQPDYVTFFYKVERN